MDFPSVFLFCTKFTWFIWRKKKISSLYRDETTIFYMVYIEEKLSFPRFFCAILIKIKGVFIFVSIPHCPNDYCIPPYSTVFIEQGFAYNSVE